MPTFTTGPLDSPQETTRSHTLDFGVLHTSPDPVLDELVGLLAQICATPIALVSVVDRERICFKARVGLPAAELPRYGPFCASAMEQPDEIFLVPDTSRDPRFADHPLVAGENGVRFYGGAVLRSPGGPALGAVCIIDHRPRTLTLEQSSALRTLGRQVMGRIELNQVLRAVSLSEERFRKMQLLSPDAQYVQVNERIAQANPAFVTLLGAANEAELIGKSIYEFIHRDHHALVRQRVQEIHRGHSLAPVEEKFVRLDGSLVEVEVSVGGFEIQGATQVMVIARDISARKRAEDVLRKTAALLEAQIESSLDGILVVDNQQRRIFQNRRCLEVWKAPPGIADADDSVQVEFAMQRTKNPRQFAERVAYLYAHPEETSRDEIELVDGTVLDRYTSPIRGKDGRIYGRIWAFRDVTDRKNAEAALRASEERFKLVARAVSDVIWDRDMISGATWRSESYVKIFGLGSTTADASDETWAANIHEQDRARVVRSFRRAIEGRAQTWSEEFRLRRVDGTYADVLNRAQIMRDANGRATRVVGGMSDLSEQKKLEAQYLRAQRMESIGTLAGGIAHDLNNVLTPILLSIDLLRAEASGKGGGQGQILDAIQSSALRGAGLVRQVLAFARGVDGERLSLNLRHLFRDLERIIGETFPRNIRITSEIAPDLRPVLGDPTQLHQVLLNLAVNARDAMPTGGSLSFSAANVVLDDQTDPDFETHQGAYVVLTVTDTGTGIPPQIRDRIFEPFFTTKDVGKGTGLGLSTVHAVVKSHGGFVSFESEVGRGTTFKIFLPADAALQAPGSRQPFPVKPARSRQELVLVVDDESAIRQVTQRMLEAFGYRVLTANDGAEAVALYSRHAQEIALVITDMMMPVMDGLATIQVLTRLNPSVRIIASSGLNATADATKASSAGVNHFLGKPYAAETLLRLVREVLDGPVPVRSG